ncbi:MAG TPA: hypothetical protein VGO47_01360 [Chlamydiales bacterium]|jgi:hypothetical protein|nr:hypothetical protein [Chlamydiales bacterium]
MQPVTADGVTQIIQTHLSRLVEELEGRITAVVMEGMQSRVSQIPYKTESSQVARHGDHNPVDGHSNIQREHNPLFLELENDSVEYMDTDELPLSLRMRSLPRAKKGNISTAWKLIIKDWYKASPPENPVALKDWRRGWYSGKNRTRYGVMYHQRRTIVEEYTKYAFKYSH